MCIPYIVIICTVLLFIFLKCSLVVLNFNTFYIGRVKETINLWISSLGLTLEGDSGEEVAQWRLTSLSRWSKAKFKLPCNFEESPYIARIFSPGVIYENVKVVFIEIYRIRYIFWKWFSWIVIHCGSKKL